MGFLIISGIIFIAVVVGMLIMRATEKEKTEEYNRRREEHQYRSPRVMVWAGIPFGVGSILFLFVYLFNALYQVPVGHYGVPVWFGNVQGYSVDDGLKHVNPMANVEYMDGRRYAFEFTGDSALVSVSKKENPLKVEVAFPFRLKQEYSWKVYLTIGDDNRYRAQLVSAARSAVRSAVAEYDWGDVTNNLDKIALRMQHYFERNVVRDLKKLGFTDAEAEVTFEFLDVQLRKIVPDKRILDATAEKMAAEQDLERQSTLTKIADEIAKRRAKEGKGVSELFNALPEGFSPAQIKEVLGALADKVRADAMLKAVETGQVDMIIMGNGGASPAVMPPQASPPVATVKK